MGNFNTSNGKLPVNIFIGGAKSYKQVIEVGGNIGGLIELMKSGQSLIDNDVIMNTTLKQAKAAIRKKLRGMSTEDIDMAPIMMWSQIIQTQKLTAYLRNTAQTTLAAVDRIEKKRPEMTTFARAQQLVNQILKGQNQLAKLLSKFYITLDENQRKFFLGVIRNYVQKPVIIGIPAKNTADAKKQIDKLLREQNVEINNIIIDCHGYYYKTGFYLGDDDKFFFDESMQIESKDISATDKKALDAWKNLEYILNKGRKSVVLNACYGANDRNSWSYKMMRREQKRQVEYDNKKNGTSKTIDDYPPIPLPDRDEGEILIEKLYTLINKNLLQHKNGRPEFKNMFNSLKARDIYASRSWFLSKPGVMMNISLEEIQLIISGLSATQAGDAFLKQHGNFEMSSILGAIEEYLRDSMGYDQSNFIMKYLMDNVVNRVSNGIEGKATELLGTNPFQFSMFELLAYGVLPKLYYTVPLVVTPGGIDEPDYYLLGANAGGHYHSKQEMRRPKPKNHVSEPADYYRRYEWENAGKWIKSEMGMHMSPTFDFEDWKSPSSQTVLSEEEILEKAIADAGSMDEVEFTDGFYLKDTGTIIFYYNGDFTTYDRNKNKGIVKWHDTLFGSLWSTLAHQFSLDSEIGLTKEERTVAGKVKIKSYPKEMAAKLMKDTPEEYFGTPHFFTKK